MYYYHVIINILTIILFVFSAIQSSRIFIDLAARERKNGFYYPKNNLFNYFNLINKNNLSYMELRYKTAFEHVNKIKIIPSDELVKYQDLLSQDWIKHDRFKKA